MTDLPPNEGWPDGKPEWADGYIVGKRLPETEDQWLIVMPLIGGRARLTIADPGNACIEGWCMPDVSMAILSFVLWPEAPQFWTRHMTRDGNFYPDTESPE